MDKTRRVRINSSHNLFRLSGGVVNLEEALKKPECWAVVVYRRENERYYLADGGILTSEPSEARWYQHRHVAEGKLRNILRVHKNAIYLAVLQPRSETRFTNIA